MSTASSGASADVPVSVVIPCYRAHATLRRALESVLFQTVQPRELIVVDDASGDGSWEELQRIQEEIGASRLRLLRLERNQGPSAARNAGWDAASAELVAFLDADASWHPRKLEIQHRFMEQRPEVAVSGHLHLVTPGAIEENVTADEPPSRPIRFNELLWRNRFITSSAMVRRDLPARFPDGQRYMEDHRLWLEVARAEYGIARIEAPLAAHHKPDFGAGGLSADLAAMERAELGNYRALRASGAIRAPMFAALTAWSMAKYLRRLAIVAGRRLSG